MPGTIPDQKMKKFSLLLLFLPATLWSQSSQVVEKPKDSYVFAQIFAGFHHSFNEDVKPATAFEFNQGIIGYKHQLGKTVTGTIMFDVTRTTHIYSITDSAGKPMGIEYFEGSKYTAYLKMAEIRWDISRWLTLRAGQLLNTQYLTRIDPFWGYRYIDVTFQEKYRFGQPADFGAQLDVRTGNKVIHQLSVVNGEGPFRYQDLNSKFICSYNIEYKPVEEVILKLYADHGPSPDTGMNAGAKSVVSFFVGYKTHRFRVGGEITFVDNYHWEKDRDHIGISAFASWNFYQALDILARYDRVEITRPAEDLKENYIVAGLQYEPVDKFTASVNFRHYLTKTNQETEDVPLIYVNFGLKF